MVAVLDGYPDEYKGYLIRTDFRIGMQICMCLADESLEQDERIITAVMLLFGNGVPPVETAIEGLNWFLNAGKEPVKKPGISGKESDSQSDSHSEEYFDFSVDADRIMTAFLRRYNVDLVKENLHWFKFLAMLGDVGQCAFTDVVGIRKKSITSNMSAEYRATLSELKKQYSLTKYTEEEQEKLDSFFAELVGKS